MTAEFGSVLEHSWSTTTKPERLTGKLQLQRFQPVKLIPLRALNPFQQINRIFDFRQAKATLEICGDFAHERSVRAFCSWLGNLFGV